MSNSNVLLPLSARLYVAGFVTVAVAYVVFLVLDIVFGWGLGWVVLGWIGAGIGSFVAVTVLFEVWYWVFEATGRAQMAREREKK